MSDIAAFQLANQNQPDTIIATRLCYYMQEDTVNIISRYPKETSLTEAAADGDIAKLVLLLDEGVEVNAKDYFGKTAIVIAAEREDKSMIKLLLNRGANINSSDPSGWTVLHYAAASGEREWSTFCFKVEQILRQ